MKGGGGGGTDVEDAPAPACYSNHMMRIMKMIRLKVVKTTLDLTRDPGTLVQSVIGPTGAVSLNKTLYPLLT